MKKTIVRISLLERRSLITFLVCVVDIVQIWNWSDAVIYIEIIVAEAKFWHFSRGEEGGSSDLKMQQEKKKRTVSNRDPTHLDLLFIQWSVLIVIDRLSKRDLRVHVHELVLQLRFLSLFIYT